MSDLAIEIDPVRLLADLRRLATFGKHGTGVSRVSFSPADVEARHWLCRRMGEAGLSAAIDGIGNVVGEAPAAGPAILIGSHADSVPEGGWLDGALGVVYGIEIARAAIEAGVAARCPVDVAAFQDEESTYLPTLGSRTLFGAVTEGEIAAAQSIDGRLLTDAVAASGFAGNPPRRLDPARYRAFLEAHIEQGPRLEAAGIGIGVVTAIVGIRRYRLEIEGQAGHAGTVPMAMRRDAGAAAIALAAAIPAAFGALAGPDTVWNIGNFALTPGAANVIPARAEIALEIRDTDPDTMDALEERLRVLAGEHAQASGQAVAVTPTLDIAPAAMDPALGAEIASAAESLDASYMRMPSGAGHDAMVLARYMPAAMLFVPSIGGHSHTVIEDTAEEDIVRGCRVLAAAVARIAGTGIPAAARERTPR